MAQREQHERVKKMDHWADKLFGHKTVVMAILVVIAMASLSDPHLATQLCHWRDN